MQESSEFAAVVKNNVSTGLLQIVTANVENGKIVAVRGRGVDIFNHGRLEPKGLNRWVANDSSTNFFIQESNPCAVFACIKKLSGLVAF